MPYSTPPTRAPRTPLLRLVIALAVMAGAWQAVPASAAPIYWGAYIKGDTYGVDDAPFDVRAIAAFESSAGKRVSIVHWGQPWFWTGQGGYMAFRRDMAERVRQRGSIPMINWNSWDLGRGGALDQPDFRLSEITAGRHDAFIRQWARDARAWGYPLFLRFDHEMNGDWFPWSERVNGNAAGQYAPMWRHVKAIFDAEGATNVTWVWAPNIVDPRQIPLASLYPGDAAVDWTGISGYNWGTNPAQAGASWRSFSQIHRETYDALRGLAPSKPIMIAETASTEQGGSKPAWITDALKSQLPVSFPQIKAVLWFNWNVPAAPAPLDWAIESSPASRAAFAAGIALPHYAANSFGALPRFAKVSPIADAPAAGGAAGAGAGAGGGAGAGPGASPAGLARGILSLAALPRCAPGRALCLRVAFRAGPAPPARPRFQIRVREVAGGRTLVRLSGRVAAGKRRVLTLSSARRPSCGRVEVRLTYRTGTATRVSLARTSIRRACTRPIRSLPPSG